MSLHLNAGATVAVCLVALFASAAIVGYAYIAYMRRMGYFSHVHFMVEHGSKFKEEVV